MRSWQATFPRTAMCATVRNDSRVALSIETDKRNAMGLTEYLVIYGTARITDGGAAELLQKLAHTYLGPGVRFPPRGQPAARVHHPHQGGPGLWGGPLGGPALTPADETGAQIIRI
jgi:hypothetical protein